MSGGSSTSTSADDVLSSYLGLRLPSYVLNDTNVVAPLHPVILDFIVSLAARINAVPSDSTYYFTSNFTSQLARIRTQPEDLFTPLKSWAEQAFTRSGWENPIVFLRAWFNAKKVSQYLIEQELLQLLQLLDLEEHSKSAPDTASTPMLLGHYGFPQLVL